MPTRKIRKKECCFAIFLLSMSRCSTILSPCSSISAQYSKGALRCDFDVQNNAIPRHYPLRLAYRCLERQHVGSRTTVGKYRGLPSGLPYARTDAHRAESSAQSLLFFAYLFRLFFADVG